MIDADERVPTKRIDKREQIELADECLWFVNSTVVTERPTYEVSDGRAALFDMLNILVGPTSKTKRQVICQPPEWRLFRFVNGPLLLTNLYNLWQISLVFVVAWNGPFKGCFHKQMNYADKRINIADKQVPSTNKK